MLFHLRAQNLGLIRDAEIEPGPGLTVITGETGAGKTLLLGALRLLVGESSDPGMVGADSEAAQADGLFSGDLELGISRIVPREGRSRSYLDGKVVSAKALREQLAGLVQIVGQHDQLELKKPRFILDLIDSNLDDQAQEILDSYSGTWQELQRALEAQSLLGGSRLELARELDLVQYQLAEISSAGFSEGDDHDLDLQSLRLKNASEIREHLASGISAIQTVEELFGELISHLRKIKDLDPGTSGITDSAESLGYSITELSRDLSANVDSLVDDPETLASIESRLNLLGNLKMKYGRTLEEILKFGEEVARREVELTELLERSTTIDEEVEKARTDLAQAARMLTAARGAAARRIEVEAGGHLRDLALETASVVFLFEGVEPGARGADRVRAMFSSHKNLELGELTRVASGGELSRLVLAINLATGRGGASTLVFDEVDSGVGGATALALARKLANLSRTQQVLCVTHLPQVAAFAESHFVVSRSGDAATVLRCEGEARLAELSRMIAGLPESERGQQAAAELLELAARDRTST